MRTWIAWGLLSLLLVPLFVGATWAVLPSVDPVAKAQRIVMMANQVTQISTLTEQLTTLTDQLSELKAQYQHLQDASMGQVQALTEPFTELASVSTGLVADGMSWRSDFTGQAAQVVTAIENMGRNGHSISATWRPWLRQAEIVTETDIVDLHATQPPERSQQAVEAWRRNEERAEKELAANHAAAEAAAELAKALKAATEALEGLKTQTNLSDTALAQAQLSGAMTQGNLIAALAQLQSLQSTKEAVKAYEDERERQRMLKKWAKGQKAAQTNLDTRIAAIERDHDRMRLGLLLKVHDAFRERP